MSTPWRTPIASALLALTLTACATSGATLPSVGNSLPPIPADIRLCFEKAAPAPPKGPLTKRGVFKLVAALKASEASKTDCGKRLIAFYEDLSKKI